MSDVISLRAPRRAESGICAAVPRRAARIMVIDDEPLIAELVRGLLVDDHVEAFVLPSVAVARAREARFDVVLCDLLMPEMTGLQVYAALRRECPHLCEHFVLMTGSAQDDSLTAFLREQGALLLQKPFRFLQLEKCVSSMIELNPYGLAGANGALRDPSRAR